jgi:hypothetical protein
MFLEYIIYSSFSCTSIFWTLQFIVFHPLSLIHLHDSYIYYYNKDECHGHIMYVLMRKYFTQHAGGLQWYFSVKERGLVRYCELGLCRARRTPVCHKIQHCMEVTGYHEGASTSPPLPTSYEAGWTMS